ncbi:MAG: deaminase [Myxococcota bacterium]
MVVIGLIGPNGSGKGVLAEFLKARSFVYHSLSDEIREELKGRKAPVTRESLVAAGTALREKYGPGVLADRVIARLEGDRNYVIDSIRNPAEVEALRRFGNFTLIKVDASAKMRFERLRERGRESDPATWEDFQALDGREAGSKDGNAQQVDAVGALADHVLTNEGTIADFEAAVSSLVSRLIGNFKRPGWDEYCISIAKVVASRSNCVKRKVGALIVKDKRIISTGYNGTPRGTKNCNEGGCPRCQALGATGADLGDCLCSHGEENAITQAAYHGTSVKEAVLYTTYSPCLLCTKMIINSGISELIYGSSYALQDTAIRLLHEAGVKVRQVRPEEL